MGPLSWELRSLPPNCGHHQYRAGRYRTRSWIQERTPWHGAGQKRRVIPENFPSPNDGEIGILSDFEQPFRVAARPSADFLKGYGVERGQLLGNM